MRQGRGVRLVGSWVAVAGVVALAVVSSASAVTAPRAVALHVTVNGSGTLRLGNSAFACHASFPTSSHCRHTFHFRRGRRIVVKASPASDWKLWRWSGACHGAAGSCSLRLKGRRFVTASFVPPGDRLNPYPLGTTATLTDGWRMKVDSALIDANAQVEAVDNQPPPPAGAQYTLVNVSMTYIGGGSSYLSDYLFTHNIDAEGAGDAGYSSDGCVPPPLDLDAVGQVFSGQTVTGNLCFRIASKDAASLLLTGEGMAGDARLPVWFALR